MSVSRMKNLIILVLSICAACLLAVAVPNRLSQTHEQRRMLAELKTLYEPCSARRRCCRTAATALKANTPRSSAR